MEPRNDRSARTFLPTVSLHVEGCFMLEILAVSTLMCDWDLYHRRTWACLIGWHSKCVERFTYWRTVDISGAVHTMKAGLVWCPCRCHVDESESEGVPHGCR